MVVIMVHPPTIPALKMRDWRGKEGHPPVRRPRIQVHLSCARSFCPSTLSEVSRQIMVGTMLEIWYGTYELRIYFFPETGVRCFRKAENIHTKVQSQPQLSTKQTPHESHSPWYHCFIFLLEQMPFLRFQGSVIQLTSRTVFLLNLNNWNYFPFSCHMYVWGVVRGERVSKLFCSLRNDTCRAMMSSKPPEAQMCPSVRNREAYRRRKRLTQNYTVGWAYGICRHVHS